MKAIYPIKRAASADHQLAITEFGLVTAGTIAGAVASWYLIWLLARLSGSRAPEMVGHYSLLLSTATPIFVFAQLGLRNVYLTITPEPSRTTLLLLRTVGVVVGSIVFIVLGISYVNVSLAVIIAMVLLKSTDTFLDLQLAFIQRGNLLHLLGVLMILNSLLTIFVVTILTTLFLSITTVLLCSAFASLVVLILCLRHNFAPDIARSGTQFATIKQITYPGMQLATSQLVSALLVYMPILLLGYYSSPSNVGKYAAAAYLLTVANLLGTSLQVTLLPTYRRAHDDGDRHSLIRSAVGLCSKLAIFLVPMAILASAAGPSAVKLIYGPEFILTRVQIIFFVIAGLLTVPAFVFSAVTQVLNLYGWQLTSMLLALLSSFFVGLFLFETTSLERLTVATVMSLAGAIVRLVALATSSVLTRKRPARD